MIVDSYIATVASSTMNTAYHQVDAAVGVLMVTGGVLNSYPCSWGGVCEEKPYVAGLQQFADRVFNSLWNAIKKLYPAEVCLPVIK